MSDLKQAGLDLPYDQYVAMIKMMEEYGAISSVKHLLGPEGRYARCVISPHAVELSRALEKAEVDAAKPKDLVETMKDSARSNRFWAMVILGFLILTAVVTFANQTIQLLKGIGILPEKAG